jgi:hypothetical protein
LFILLPGFIRQLKLKPISDISLIDLPEHRHIANAMLAACLLPARFDKLFILAQREIKAIYF